MARGAIFEQVKKQWAKWPSMPAVTNNRIFLMDSDILNRPTSRLIDIRLPRVFLATLVGAALSLGGLVFQALLRNPLAEPYILGISSGSGIGAIIGILVGLSPFPGVSVAAFGGSMATLLLLLFMTTGKTMLKKDILLLSGVMVNAIATSIMVSATVASCGPIGFVGLVIPHLLRLMIGPDHRVLVPACLLGGGAYVVLCDILARTLPEQGEMPAGVITAMIGAPLFIILLKKSGS
ncbi:MAG: hypothetical protein B6240_10675 [Desulfobacteraceae bacterium 4572_87]|nr:MAG: hypothetical protein B6240_10675 [Desulfobacteraceae bacterium 4572_87]